MSQRKEASSPWAVRIATVAGIPIRLHFTFLLLLLWLAFVASNNPQSAKLALIIVSIFICVVLHELGHSLTAKSYGLKIREIVLYPIGGVAMLLGRPKPLQEFWIALAGPAVNLVIAGVIASVFLILYQQLPTFMWNFQKVSYWEGVYTANLVLLLFNMIPAFPMDGGRVLRSLLAMRIPEDRATQIAGTIGQALAIGFGIFAIFSNHFILLIIAFFVFMGASQETAMTRTFSLISGKKIIDAMITDFKTIEHSATLDVASQMLLEGSQQDFPVVFGDEVLGLLKRENIVMGLSNEGAQSYVSGYMTRDYNKMSPYEPLEKVIEKYAEGDRSPILVFDESNKLVGMVTIENMGELMMLEEARKRP